MLKVLLTFMLAAFAFQLFAQDFQEGIVVEADGDTVRGFIEYKRWDRSPVNISFKRSVEATSTRYHPIDIRSFTVAGETYESAIVDVDVSPHKIAELSYSPTPEFVKDTVFMQVLVRGEKSLLHLKDRNAKNHFYIITDKGRTPLVYKQYLLGGGMGKAIAENQAYKGVLADYLRACPSIQSKLKGLTYDDRSLKKLFDYYYDCTHQSKEYETNRKEGRLELGVVAGASLTTLKFTGPVEYITDNDYEPSLGPTLGVFLDVKLLRSNNWTISNDIMYTSFNIKGEGVREVVNSSPEYTSRASFNYHYLKTHHLLQMNMLKKNILFVAVGFSTGFVIKDDYSITIQYRNSSNESPRPFATRNLEFGYLGGIGYRVGKWSIEGRYELSSGMSDFVELQGRTTRVYTLLKYRFR